MRKIVVQLYLIAFGVLVGHHLNEWSDDKVSTAKVVLTDEERLSPVLLARTFPTTFLVRIKSIEEIKSLRGEATANADALTFVTRDLCEIWLPSDQGIVFSPGKKAAHWVRGEDGDVFAHELLHCLRGAWHEDKKLMEGGR